AGRAMREHRAVGSRAGALHERSAPMAAAYGRPAAREVAWEKSGIAGTGDGVMVARRAVQQFAPARHGERELRDGSLRTARGAPARRESRGALFRSDFPKKVHAFEKHSVIRKDAPVSFR